MSSTDDDRDDRVRRRAYELWEAAGRPEGQGDEFWHEAWDEITSELAQDHKSEIGPAAPEPTSLTKSERPDPGTPKT